MPQNGKIEIGEKTAKKFKEVVKKRGKKWSVLVAQVDPDGIATAFAVKMALEHHGAEAGIFYAGGFGHPQNKILYNEFELVKHLLPVKDLPPDTTLALADSSRLSDSRFRGADGRRMNLAPARFGLVVDHHLENLEETEDFLPIVLTCGAAATLGWKLLHAVGGKPDERLCALTAVGIHSDTDRLTHPITKAADREVLNEAMRETSQEFIDSVFNYTLPERYLEIYRQVLETLEVVGGRVRIAHAGGLLNEDEGDYLSIVADSLRKVKGAETTVIWGIAGKELRASVRTRDKQELLTTLIEAIFGAGNGGAKYGSGGARYMLLDPHVPFPDTAELFVRYLDAQFKRRVALFLGTSDAPAKAKTDKTAS